MLWFLADKTAVTNSAFVTLRDICCSELWLQSHSEDRKIMNRFDVVAFIASGDDCVRHLVQNLADS